MGDEKTPYEIGLSMAGAVSAGAYSAGVLDFLIEALDKWHRAKEKKPEEVPNHEVRLKAIAGSSAGGMTGVSAASALSSEHQPITSLPGKKPDSSTIESNKLYSAWVEQIDISPLLGGQDRSDPDNKVNSLLDSTVLKEIAEKTLDFEPKTEQREYLADPMYLLLTVTNLKGVPYDISFKGVGDAAHRTARQADYKEFALTRTDHGNSDTLQLDPTDPESLAWKKLRNYGLATGAFPGGLKPRHLKRERRDYEERKWTVPLRPDQTNPPQCRKSESIVPSWSEANRNEEGYQFLAVDGGAMNNEPLELARQKLAGNEHFIPRSPEKATGSVILVDPLPSDRLIDKTENDDIVSVFSTLFDGLMNQARFKPDQLLLARNLDVYSRFLIRPLRRDDGSKKKHPIASEMLSGFGGFLKKSFRMHDFQLGRRNCQKFLRNYFVIPRDACDENPVFSHYSKTELDTFSYFVERKSSSDTKEVEVMPIIHLVDSIDPEMNPEHKLKWTSDWMKMSDRELNDLKKGIESRTKVVLDSLIDQYTNTWYGKAYAKFGAWGKRGSIIENIMDTINNQLEEYNLRA